VSTELWWHDADGWEIGVTVDGHVRLATSTKNLTRTGLGSNLGLDRHSLLITVIFEIFASFISDELSPKYRDGEFRRESHGVIWASFVTA
jgi:hypothetical protein